MAENPIYIKPIGVIRSPLIDPASAPMQGDEGGVEAWLEVNHDLAEGLTGIKVGDHLTVLTWLHRADREVLQVHPRGDPDRPLKGVFGTRSPHRPNPIGLHPVKVLEIAGTSLKVAPLEAIDGTPIIDIKTTILPKTER
jgi:tRNA-Thr(GGU) m(6)t(6)A37 methyltransferase TsaA